MSAKDFKQILDNISVLNVEKLNISFFKFFFIVF